jgi:hypothetical protein
LTAVRATILVTCVWAWVACGGGENNTASASDTTTTATERQAALAVTSRPTPAVTSFTVVDAATGADIATFTGSGTVSMAATPRINVRANAANAGSVVFVEGAHRRTESSAPFALRGDSNGHYNAWEAAEGTYLITATPYAGSGASGTAGAVATLSLTVIKSAPPPPPPPGSSGAPHDVTSLLLVNASNGAAIRSLQANDTLDLSDLGASSISVQALTNPGAKSVRFESAGVSRIEGSAPWAFLGNSGAAYTPWKPEAKTYTITATGYSGPGATGTAGAPFTVTIKVTAGDTPPASPPADPAAVAHTYQTNAGPDRNPHKGWNSGWFSPQPESSVGFQYLAWKDFEPINGSFDFDKVEQILARAGSKGQHFVLRLYCEWDGRDAVSSCPAWLYSELGVRRLSGDNGQRLTDFNDPKYLDRAVQAIQALAQRYDGDPRVHAFQLGVLGFWGEWHTHGFKQAGVGYTITDASKTRILEAYKTHFKKAPLQGRYPWREPLTSADFIGFHNDFFVPKNSHSNEFDATLAASGQWKNGPIGGEAPPRSSSEAATEKPALFRTSTGQTMIETARYSTMSPGAYRVTAGDPYHPDYMRLHRLMGYNFRIDQAVFRDAVDTTQDLAVRLEARNVGVARLYHPWSAQFALLDGQGLPVAQSDAPVDLAAVGPGGTFSLAATLQRIGLAAGSYRLAVRLIQPGAGAAKPKPWGLDARNAYILFANDLQVIDGAWSSDHALIGGWSVLGTVALR